MAFPSPAPLLVLHAVRLKGRAGADALGAATGLGHADLAARLVELTAGGLVVNREGRVAGWSLTPEGRQEHGRRLRAELDESGLRPAVEATYRRFLSLNGELLAACAAWQMRSIGQGDAMRNDHRDPAYDEGVIGRLGALHSQARPVCDELACAFERFSRYGPRLARALERVEGGEGDWFTRPLIDSYHSVWFELHEDLLVTLGLERRKGA